MTEVLSQGPDRPPSRRAVIAAVAAGVVALGAFGVVTLTGHGPSEGAAGGRPAASPGPGSLPAVPGALPRPPWPTRSGACGSDIRAPVLDAEPMLVHTGARLLTGGSQLAEVDPDAGGVRVIARIDLDREYVSAVARAGAASYALVARCDTMAGRDRGASAPRLLHLDAAGRAERVRLSGPVDDLVSGAGHVWGVDYPDTLHGRVLLRAPGGGTLVLPRDVGPAGVSRAGIIGVTSRADGPDGLPPTMLVISPATGARVSTVGTGSPLAVAPGFVLSSGLECDGLVVQCALYRHPVPGTGDGAGGSAGSGARSYPLPPERVPTSLGALSPDGRKVAFQLSRAEPDPRYDTDHPGPPSDVAVLNLGTGLIDIVPGLELPPKTTVGLAFSADSRWLFVTISEGDHGHVLAWRSGLERPLRSAARLPGPLSSQGPPVLALAGH